MAAIALTIQDLSTRVSEVEGMGDIGYAVTPISELEHSLIAALISR